MGIYDRDGRRCANSCALSSLPNNHVRQSASFTYTLGGDTPSSITYNVDGGSAVAASGGAFSVSGLAVGSHSVVMTVSNNGGSSNSNTASVTVVASCSNGQGAAGSCTSCNSGYVLSGGSCFLQCPNGQGAAGSCTSCNSGYVLSGGSCAVQCPNGQGASGNCSSCNAGYMLSGGSCVLGSAPGTLGTGSSAFSASPSRVQKGESSTLGWTTNGMVTCGIAGSDGSVPLISGTPVSDGQHTATASNITKDTAYTLTCVDGNNNSLSEQATVTLVPSYQEI